MNDFAALWYVWLTLGVVYYQIFAKYNVKLLRLGLSCELWIVAALRESKTSTFVWESVGWTL